MKFFYRCNEFECGAWNESFYGECNGQVDIRCLGDTGISFWLNRKPKLNRNYNAILQQLMKFNHFSSSEDFAVVCTKTLETEMRAGKISKWNTRDNH